MQALYQWQLGGGNLSEIEGQFYDNPKLPDIDKEYFEELVRGVSEDTKTLEIALKPHCNLAFEEVDPVERAILWVATFELLQRLDIPYRIVINEAIELAKNFGAQDSHAFVNGVLDALAKKARTIETTPE